MVPTGAGAYRAAMVRPLCSVCKAATDGASCPRCGKALCAEHAVAGDRRCDACEGDYALIKQDRERHPLPGWAVPALYGGSSAAALGVLLTMPWQKAPVLTVLLVLVLGVLPPLGLAAWRRARVRRGFLRESAERRKLTAPSAPESDSEKTSNATVGLLSFFREYRACREWRNGDPAAHPVWGAYPERQLEAPSSPKALPEPEQQTSPDRR